MCAFSTHGGHSFELLRYIAATVGLYPAEIARRGGIAPQELAVLPPEYIVPRRSSDEHKLVGDAAGGVGEGR